MENLSVPNIKPKPSLRFKDVEGLQTISQRIDKLEQRPKNELLTLSQQIKTDSLETELQNFQAEFLANAEDIENIFDLIQYAYNYTKQNIVSLSLLLNVKISSKLVSGTVGSLVRLTERDISSEHVQDFVEYLSSSSKPVEIQEAVEKKRSLFKRKDK